MVAGLLDKVFDERLHRIVDAAPPSMGPAELAEFLESPNVLLDGLRPWDLLTASAEAEFQRVVALVKGVACRDLKKGCAARRSGQPSGGRAGKHPQGTPMPGEGGT